MTFVKGKVKTVYETNNPEEIIIQLSLIHI